MKGYRTLFVGLGFAVIPSILQYLGAVDWSVYIGPVGAFFVSGLIAVGMRFVTSTPIGGAGGIKIDPPPTWGSDPQPPGPKSEGTGGNALKLAIALSLPFGIAACNPDPKTLQLAAAYAATGCLIVDAATGAGVTATEMNLPPGSDPAASKTLAKWQSGQKIAGPACDKLVQALQVAGANVTGAAAK